MSIDRLLYVGYANGDIHSLQVMRAKDLSRAATDEAKNIGKLTNAGFCTLVVAAWLHDEKKTAGVSYAAVWNENEPQIILHHGDGTATSHELYEHCRSLNGKSLTSANLANFCRKLKTG